MLTKKGKITNNALKVNKTCAQNEKNFISKGLKKEPKKMKDDKLTKFREEKLKFTTLRFAHKMEAGWEGAGAVN
jgi:hypothetical protein